MPDRTRNEARAADGDAPAARRRRYVPSSPARPVLPLTPVKVRMLRFLAELRFLALPQLARLCCPADRKDLSEKSARRHLRALFNAGLVDVLPVSRAALAPPDAAGASDPRYGSAPNVYALTPDGLRRMRRAGLVSEAEAWRPPPAYGPRGGLFLAHELMVRDVRVWLEECTRKERAEGGLLEWRDGAEAVIDLGRERPPREARPDAWFACRVGATGAGGAAVLVGLVEADRGTERGERHWREKLAAYRELFAGGRLRETTGYVNARVLVVCPDARRRDRLAGLIARGGGDLAGRFWLAERGALDLADLQAPVWRQAGGSLLRPLVPPGP